MYGNRSMQTSMKQYQVAWFRIRSKLNWKFQVSTLMKETHHRKLWIPQVFLNVKLDSPFLLDANKRVCHEKKFMRQTERG